MPEDLVRCVSDLKSQGKSEDSAWAICVDSTGEKPHKETAEDSMMKQVLETKLKGCGCQKKKHS